MPPNNDEALSDPQYWDDQYAGGHGHEWFRSFGQLEPFFEAHMFSVMGFRSEDNPRILHLGSGESTVPLELASRGYQKQTSIDFSDVVIRRMTELARDQSNEWKNIEWQQMDVRNMTGISDKSIDVAFDKGTLDAMIYGSPWDPPDKVLQNTDQYQKEIHRVLKDSGVFLYITFRQPHFVTRLLDRGDLWGREVHTLGETGSFDYYGFVLRKRTS